MPEINRKGALAGERYRVIISTDIGGSDPDDFQSMVHFFLYSDLFDTEGLISSPWGPGRKKDIYTVIDAYEKDYPYLKTWSDQYPTPLKLREITKQGTVDIAPWKGWSQPSEASEWIVRCARKMDSRPLYLLMWGLLEDLAQALHDAPDIVRKLRVHYIGGPNKKWGQNAYAYIRSNFPDLWMIENNSTYRGWFNGGNMDSPWGNESFVETFVSDHGYLGDFFASQLGGTIKMGDTPTVAWLLYGDPQNPEADSWGGSFEKVRSMPAHSLVHPVNEDMPIEMFSEAEILFHGPRIEDTEKAVFTIKIRGQQFDGYYTGNGEYRFRFVPKETGVFPYLTQSLIPELNGLAGYVKVLPENPETRNSGNLTSWWSDKLDLKYSEGPHRGAKTISQWRKQYLQSFADRLIRCSKPND